MRWPTSSAPPAARAPRWSSPERARRPAGHSRGRRGARPRSPLVTCCAPTSPPACATVEGPRDPSPWRTASPRRWCRAPRQGFPDDLVVGEEARRWPRSGLGPAPLVLDPLDGTTNFVKVPAPLGGVDRLCGADDRWPPPPSTFPHRRDVHGGGRPWRGSRGEALRAPDAPCTRPGADRPAGRLTAAVPLIGRAVLSLRVTGSTVYDLADRPPAAGPLLACARAAGTWPRGP